jgi:hypothetical protein
MNLRNFMKFLLQINFQRPSYMQVPNRRIDTTTRFFFFCMNKKEYGFCCGSRVSRAGRHRRGTLVAPKLKPKPNQRPRRDGLRAIGTLTPLRMLRMCMRRTTSSKSKGVANALNLANTPFDPLMPSPFHLIVGQLFKFHFFKINQIYIGI